MQLYIPMTCGGGRPWIHLRKWLLQKFEGTTSLSMRAVQLPDTIGFLSWQCCLKWSLSICKMTHSHRVPLFQVVSQKERLFVWRQYFQYWRTSQPHGSVEWGHLWSLTLKSWKERPKGWQDTARQQDGEPKTGETLNFDTRFIPTDVHPRCWALSLFTRLYIYIIYCH